MSVKSERMLKFRAADLYLVITREFCAGRPVLDVLKAAADGGIRLVQLREKDLPDRDLAHLAVEFRKVCDSYGILMIMNDHTDIAQWSGADGVHLGQADLPLDAARSIAPELILGRSTHSAAQALEAQEQGADYVNLGPILPTHTKATPVAPLGMDIINEAGPRLSIPFTVMGGLKERHIPELLERGARIVAMVTEITQAPDIAARVRELRALWTRA